MKNSFVYFIFLFFLNCNTFLIAGELEINSNKINYDNNNKTTIFEGDVTSSDQKGNKIFSEYAKYDKLKDIIETKGATKIMTSNGYEVLGSNITLDNKKNIIYSNYKTIIVDKDGNNISTDMFNYSILTNIFFSKGNIEIKDINENKYNFSEIYIDENSKKIIGSDVRAFLNQPNIVANNDNEPRFFANTISIAEGTSKMEKGIFTYCKKKREKSVLPGLFSQRKLNII